MSIASSVQTVNAGQATNLTVTTNDPKGVTWSLSGQGSLSGVTSTSVTYTAPTSVPSGFVATVTATSVSNPKISKSVAINVASSTLTGSAVTIWNDSLPNGVVTVNYNWLPGVTGGVAPYTYNVSAGTLPPGLIILGSSNGTPYPSGTIYGTPTAVGTSYFTLKVTDSASPPDVATQNLSITINPAGTLTISPSTLNNGELGVGYQQRPLISGGTQNYTVSVTAGILPPGLQVSANNQGANPVGYIYGDPSTAGTYSFTYQATDSSYPPNVANANYSITILPAGTFAILTTTLPSGEVGAGYNQQPLASGGIQPYTFSISAGALPPGVTLTTSTGVLSGSPTAAGTYSFTYTATDFSIPPKTATANLSIKIFPAVTITTTTLPDASVGTVYVSPPMQATGGAPPYSFNSSSLPISLTERISFLPQVVGVQSSTISVVDSIGASASTTLNVTVDPANCPNNGNFHGNYAMVFNGPAAALQRSVEQTLFVGSFVADGAGNISQGYMDMGGDTVTSTGLTGTYCIGPTNQGTLVYQRVYLMNVDSGGNADFIVYQIPDPAIIPVPFGFGSLAKQDTTAFNASDLVGQYSFGLLSGAEQAGTFSSDGAGNLTDGEFDETGSGNPYNTTFTANDLAVAPFGRGTVTLNEPSGGSVSEIFYIVNSSELFAVASNSTFLVTGPIIQATGGPYSNASLNGVSVFGLQGISGISGEPLKSQIGLITWDGSGNFTLTADQNQSGALTTVSYSGTYNVESDGRVTLTSGAESAPPIFYLSGPNQGFILGMGANVSNGQFFQQSSGPFESSSFSGNYLGRMLNTYVLSENDYCCSLMLDTELDNFSSDGVSSLTGTAYQDDFWNGPYSAAVSSTYTVDSSGRGIVTASGSQTNIFYVVSPTQVLMMPSTTQYPKVMSVTQP